MNFSREELVEEVRDIWANEDVRMLRLVLLFEFLGQGRNASNSRLEEFNRLYTNEEGEITLDLLLRVVVEHHENSSNVIFYFLLGLLDEDEYEQFLNRDNEEDSGYESD